MRFISCAFVLFLHVSCGRDQAVPSAALDAWSRGDAVAARRLLHEHAARHGWSGEARRLLAECAMQQGDAAEAAMALRAALAADPDDAQAALALAGVYKGNGRYDDALHEYDRLRAHGRLAPAVELERATVLALAGRIDEAGAEFARLRSAEGMRDLADYNSGLLAVQRGDLAAAQRLFEAVVASQPAWSPARRELARTLLSSHPGDRAAGERALDLLVTDADIDDADWRAWEAVGDAWMALGDIDAALQAYVEALRAGGNPPSVEDRYRAAVRRKRSEGRRG